MSELLFGLCFCCHFKQNSQVFVSNKCVLWLQSRSCFTANFCYLTLSSMYWNQGLNFAKFFIPWFCLLITAVLPKRLYKTHTPCIHYHLREKKHRLLLWPCTSPCPLSTSWHLFRMVCFSLFPPHPSPWYLGPVSFIRKRPPDFSIT